MENGYRTFSKSEIETLLKVKTLRSLGLNINDIKRILLDESIFSNLIASREISLIIDKRKIELLKELNDGLSYKDIQDKLLVIERQESIRERLINSFPGYLGYIIGLQFSSFLNEKIRTKEQQEAYNNIIEFLDNLDPFIIPKELEESFQIANKSINNNMIEESIMNKNEAIENTDEFLNDNEKMINEYLEYKKSDEYKNSDAAKLEKLIKDFMATNGFYDIFIKNMRTLSKSYDDYYVKLLEANEKLLKKIK